MVVSSLFTGFIRTFERSATDLIGDILLLSPSRFDHADELIEDLRGSGLVRAAAASTQIPGLLHIATGNVRPVQVWGIEVADLMQVTSLGKWLVGQAGGPITLAAQATGRVPAIVGIGLLLEPDPLTDRYDVDQARKLIGQRLVLTCPAISNLDPNQQPQRPMRRTIELVIADILHTGNWLFDQQAVLLPSRSLQLDPNSSQVFVDRIQIRLANGMDPQQAIATISLIWGRFAQGVLGWGPYQVAQAEILPARQLQARFLAEVRKQLGVLLVIFGVVDTAAIVLVFCVFYMLARLKVRDIAILKACGCPSSQIVFLFLGLGTVVGAIGAGFGVVLGYLFTHNINYIEDRISSLIGIRLWDSSAYLFEHIPDQVAWDTVWIIVLLATVAAAIGALAPAMMAARARPVEILRYE
jgi:ABC-type lipoprotein release transport system permease subunit